MEQPTGIAAGLDGGGNLGGETWLKLLFLRTLYEEGLIYRDLKVSGFWLSIIHFLCFSGKQSVINNISFLPLPAKEQALSLDLNPGQSEGEAENRRTGPHQLRASLRMLMLPGSHCLWVS